MDGEVIGTVGLGGPIRSNGPSVLPEIVAKREDVVRRHASLQAQPVLSLGLCQPLPIPAGECEDVVAIHVAVIAPVSASRGPRAGGREPSAGLSR
jgi:hypothetical protein